MNTSETKEYEDELAHINNFLSDDRNMGGYAWDIFKERKQQLEERIGNEEDNSRA